MLNNYDFLAWCISVNLKKSAKQLIEMIRTSEPSRNVGSNGTNVRGRYPSKKMARTIQFESHTVELSIISELEHDPEVLEYYDQPPAIKLNYYSIKSNRNIGVLHTPDFFVIRKKSAGWIECKDDKKLEELRKHNNNRYDTTNENIWICPPGERFADEYGLFYEVKPSSSISYIYIRNMNYLEDYYRAERHIITQDVIKKVNSIIAKDPSITLTDLIKSAEGITPDDIYYLIAYEKMYVNLYTNLLVESDKVNLFSSKVIAEAYLNTNPQLYKDRIKSSSFNMHAGSRIMWDGMLWTIINTGESSLGIMDDDGRAAEVPNTIFMELVKKGSIVGTDELEVDKAKGAKEFLINASEKDLSIANTRYQIIKAIESGGDIKEYGISTRTLRDWMSKYRFAEQSYGWGYIGLLPLNKEKGNKLRKLPESTIKLIDEMISSEYESIQQKNKLTVYRLLFKKCTEEGVLPPSYKYFTSCINKKPKYEQVLKREGKRAAYQNKSFYWELSQSTPRHGDRPFEICHIDHTELDIELICSRTGKNLGRPWCSFLVDAYTRRILALYLTYDPPSYRSCMMALRECVKRHGRLPQYLVVDGGKEFASTYFETLLARYEVAKKTRPAGKARFGSVCERLFGTVNTQFIHNIIGNTQIMRKVRQVTKRVNPRYNAAWTLGEFYDYLCEWAYEVYDQTEHPNLGQSPREQFISGLKQFGTRSCRMIIYDNDFHISTLPTTKKGSAKVEPSRGVKINYFFYWHHYFRLPDIEKTQVPIRYDPFDLGCAYAFVKGQWVKCISQYNSILQGRTEKELQFAFQEIKKGASNHAKNAITAKNIVDFLKSTSGQDRILIQQLRDKEVNSTLQVLEGGKNGTINVSTETCFNKKVDLQQIGTLELYGEF